MFNNDPFFSAHMQHINQINQMMSDPFRMMGMDMSPFGSMLGGGSSQLGITDGRERQRDMARRPERNSRDLLPAESMMDPFGTRSLFGNMFQNVNSLMSNIQGQVEQARNDPNAHFFSQSSVMSYSNTGEGPPKVFQAMTSTRQAPGGIRETRKALRDSEAAIEKMAIGRHIGDKGLVKERVRHVNTGDTEENQEFVNLDEEEAPVFDEEWRAKTQQFAGRGRQSRVGHSQNTLAITDGQARYDHHAHRSRPYPQRPNHGHTSGRMPVQPHRDRSRSPSQSQSHNDGD